MEQGTSHIGLELMDANSRKLLASMKLDPVKDVLEAPEGEKAVREREFAMKPKSKGILNPRVKLTIRRDMLGTEEEGLRVFVSGAYSKVWVQLIGVAGTRSGAWVVAACRFV